MQIKPESRVYAGFFVRLAAYLIDILLVGAVLLIIRIPLWFSTLINPDNLLVQDFIFQYSIMDIVLYLLKVTYFVLLTYFTGSTLGKKLLQIRVVSKEDREITFFEVLYRETVGRFLSGVILGLGYLMVGPDKEKQGLHDMLSDTRVVYFHERKVYVRAPIAYREVGSGRYVSPQELIQPGEKVLTQPMAQTETPSMPPQDSSDSEV